MDMLSANNINFPSCQNVEYIQFKCLDEDYRRLLRLSENEFRAKLKDNFEGENDKEILTKFLLAVTKNQQPQIEPSKKLKKQINRGPMIRDIWNLDKSPNLKGDFINCLKKSETKFLKEYCDRVINGGDMSPQIVAKGLIDYIEKNDLKEYVYLVSTINFYLITMN